MTKKVSLNELTKPKIYVNLNKPDLLPLQHLIQTNLCCCLSREKRRHKTNKNRVPAPLKIYCSASKLTALQKPRPRKL